MERGFSNPRSYSLSQLVVVIVIEMLNKEGSFDNDNEWRLRWRWKGARFFETIERGFSNPRNGDR